MLLEQKIRSLIKTRLGKECQPYDSPSLLSFAEAVVVFKGLGNDARGTSWCPVRGLGRRGSVIAL